MTDTIAAIATARGEGAIGIIRLSGEQALTILNNVFRNKDNSSPRNRWEGHRHYFGVIIDPDRKRVIDEVLATFMPKPHSYSGEDTVEISAHGGRLILEQILEVVIKQGARLARRGEFTRRAFLNGKIDLLQAEAVIDLIRSPTAVGSQIATDQLRGKLSEPIKSFRQRLLDLLAHLEASLDFPEDLAEPAPPKILEVLTEVRAGTDTLLGTAEAGRVLREGVRVAIVGRPNVGKSSLLNALLGFERAIVTEVPGTTRDTLEETVNVNGVPLIIIDTAGLRNAENRPEEMGVERTRHALAEAELTLVVLDQSEELTEEDHQIFKEISSKKAVLVLNKTDKTPKLFPEKLNGYFPDLPRAEISALYGTGIDQLERVIVNQLMPRDFLISEEPLLRTHRHKETLFRAKVALEKATETVNQSLPMDLVTIDLKEAVAILGEMTGETVSEEVLNRIFAEFCIGK